jgi:7,8-dihydroneopterin aldolase/epimerase/oxygenase
MPADSLHIEGLRVAAWIGVPAEERAQPQALSVTLDLVPLRPLSGLHDDLERTIDYQAVAAQVRGVAASQKRRLIETLADDIADALLASHPLNHVRVEIRKFILPHCDHVAVVLHKARDD